MPEVTIRELSNRGGRVVDRVAAGERLTITRGGRPVAELRPVCGTAVRATVLLRRWRRLPPTNAAALRADLDATLESGL